MNVKEDLSRYLEDVRRHALLSVDEEQALARAYRDRGDSRAAHALVTANLRFVVKVASGYRGYGLRLADLIQEGNLGLLKAVTKFDPDQASASSRTQRGGSARTSRRTSSSPGPS
jgi:RNA polymerase sigma-32 factor